MSKVDDGGPAFPQNDAAVNRINNHDGMSLRDYFAAAALQGIIASYANPGAMSYPSEADEAAKDAYAFSDAMLKARNQTDDCT